MTAATCGGCDARWTAMRAAHCSSCHRTFGGVTGFDTHRRNGRCLTPAKLGMELRDGIWRQPDGRWSQ